MGRTGQFKRTELSVSTNILREKGAFCEVSTPGCTFITKAWHPGEKGNREGGKALREMSRVSLRRLMKRGL